MPGIFKPPAKTERKNVGRGQAPYPHPNPPLEGEGVLILLPLQGGD